MPLFQMPKFPEWFLTTSTGRRLLRLLFTIREGCKGTMDRGLADALVANFQGPADMHGPVEYYREMVRTQLHKNGRGQLAKLYSKMIDVRTTLVGA